MQTYQIPIKDLFQILEIDNSTYEELIENKHNINIKSPNGFVPIKYFIKKNHHTADYILENTSLSCSINHLVYSKGNLEYIKNCEKIDTTDGVQTVEGIIDKGKQDVYDVSIDPPHEYVTPNGVIHHNTTLARVLINELDINDLDFKEINASRTNSIDDVRDTIVNFVQMIPFGDFKVVLLDEADYLSPNAQAALRGVMEEYPDFARFILTCNYPNRIISAIHSRCQGFHLATIDQEEFATRVAQILLNENVSPDPDVLDTYIKTTYPDLRKCINMVQMGVKDGELLPPSKGDSGEVDWKPEMVDLFKQGKIQEARQLLCGKVRPEEMEEVYRWVYDNIDLFGDTEEKKDQAILILKQGLTDHALVADPEINLSATLIKLARNYEK